MMRRRFLWQDAARRLLLCSNSLSFLCCCWLFRDCFGRRQGPTTPLMAPPQRPVDDRPEQFRGTESPFGWSKPHGPTSAMHDSLEPLGGPHSPFGVSNPPGHNPFRVSNRPDPLSPMDDRLAHLGGPHSPFGVPDAPGPLGQYRPSVQHGSFEPPRPHGPPRLPEPPRVPGVQPGLL
ncbi:hypothetical protein QVD17_04092 [Tagetes erecta]|uniref:Uncharacterized protein n=1 Tax=Tagetes erecta TaxID=13708 RepID=A0AAD8P413_TARER|nr:hypothetical protein QVD17_04092 [Tagetes erecta]